MQTYMPWVAVALLGGTVGCAELVSRYRDAPSRALQTLPAILYMLINVLASTTAYGMAKLFDWKINLGTTDNAAAGEWTLVIVCGVSAMALFRSSLFVRRVGDQDIGVGPSTFLQIFLTAADAEVDRQSAIARSNAVARIMANVDYDKARKALPPYCLALMQSLSEEMQRGLGVALDLLHKEDSDPHIKVRTLGLELVNVVGIPVVEQAVESLRDRIMTVPVQHVPGPPVGVAMSAGVERLRT